MRPGQTREGRPDTLAPAVEQALNGTTKPLFELLMRGSGLPGTRVNMPLAEAFAAATLAYDERRVDQFLDQLLRTSADELSGGSPYEYLPVCAVIAIGIRAAHRAQARRAAIPRLFDAADDLRFRVRDAVPIALATIGKHMGDDLLAELAGWSGQFNQAAALLRTLSMPHFLDTLHNGKQVAAYLDECFRLLWNAPRSAERYPGYKALHDALLVAPPRIALRFGVPVFEMMQGWVRVKEPLLREIVTKVGEDEKLGARHPDEIRVLALALSATEPPRRDPRSYVGPTRGRGRKKTP
jgi:hypothetical protein